MVIYRDVKALRNRGSAILIENKKVALIKRTRNSSTYYVFPGGGIEKGETPEAAAVREAMEELGVHICIEDCFEQVQYNGTQYYFLANITGGTFGTGNGEEFSSDERGYYEPIWMDIDSLNEIDVRPKVIADKLYLSEVNEY